MYTLNMRVRIKNHRWAQNRLFVNSYCHADRAFFYRLSIKVPIIDNYRPRFFMGVKKLLDTNYQSKFFYYWTWFYECEKGIFFFLNPFITFSSFTGPCYVQTLFSLNCLQVTISEFLHKCFRVSCGAFDFKKIVIYYS